jgi:hypothetical protein
MIDRVTEREITLALKERHDKRGDFFASQVKMGAAGSKILDGVAIPSTWSPRTIIGYEIKVTRSDFLSDNKYPHYMETCNRFYFVVPKGLIKKDEVPRNVGIIEYNNGKLRQIKHAIYEKREISTDMLLHCIFFKVHQYNRGKSRKELFEDVKVKVESREYGHELAKKLRELERPKLGDTNEHREWIYLQERIFSQFGKRLNTYEIIEYLDPNNKKYNDAVHLLKRAVEKFKE